MGIQLELPAVTQSLARGTTLRSASTNFASQSAGTPRPTRINNHMFLIECEMDDPLHESMLLQYYILYNSRCITSDPRCPTLAKLLKIPSEHIIQRCPIKGR
jgi:hypothetical protein